ncbi:Transcriptional regulator [Ceratobasidium theobromae]|uniref:Transcriptional regulator n=1 Tax=Ceratobasidium theobromae TaxID=1582974 RepID=A0A5N5QR29_9AGAM|nr:Transcriptional regulator [Ceratobasidium theobromae]
MVSQSSSELEAPPNPNVAASLAGPQPPPHLSAQTCGHPRIIRLVIRLEASIAFDSTLAISDADLSLASRSRLNRIAPPYGRCRAAPPKPAGSSHRCSLKSALNSNESPSTTQATPPSQPRSGAWLPPHKRHNRSVGRKSASDAKKGAIYSKAIQAIVIAAKVGGGSLDPAINHALDVALKNARSLGLPKDNIQAAMDRIANASAQDAQQSATYEAIGPGQVGLVIECLTDNTTRTAKKVREILSNNDARLAPVAYLFSRSGQIRLTPAEGASFEVVWDAAVDAGAEDVTEIAAEASESGSPEVLVKTPPNLLATLASKLSRHTLHSVELAYIPNDDTADSNLSEPDQNALQELIEELEDNPDVVRVWTSV